MPEQPNPFASITIPPVGGDVVLLPAKITDRFIAYVMDAAPFCAGYGVSLYMIVAKWHSRPYSGRLDAQIGLAWFALYLFYQLIGNAAGATVGKAIMGLRIVRKDGQPLGFFGAIMRTIGYIIGTPLGSWGFVIALFHPESRALHDILSGSVVIEPRSRNQATSMLLFAFSTLLLLGMYAGVIISMFNHITEKDLAAVEKAKEGLMVMAEVEQAYKTSHTAYTSSMADLAEASGDAAKFRSAMSEIFDPNQFQLEAGNRGYRLSGKALDRRRTRVTLEGPPPQIVQ